MENLSLSVPDLLQTVKNYVGTDKHEQLDEMLRRYTSKQLGKQQLQFELRVVAGRDALRQALLSSDSSCAAAAATTGGHASPGRAQQTAQQEALRQKLGQLDPAQV